MNNLKKISTYKTAIYDFDGTIARIEIDWSGWHEFTEKYFRSFDADVVYVRSPEIHRVQNDLVRRFGSKVSKTMSEFNREYEFTHMKSMTPNPELIEFI